MTGRNNSWVRERFMETRGIQSDWRTVVIRAEGERVISHVYSGLSSERNTTRPDQAVVRSAKSTERKVVCAKYTKQIRAKLICRFLASRKVYPRAIDILYREHTCAIIKGVWNSFAKLKRESRLSQTELFAKFAIVTEQFIKLYK